MHKESTKFLLELVRKVSNAIGYKFSSVPQSCLTVCDPMYYSTPGFPVHHQLLEPTQTHVHRIRDASNHLILSCPLLLPPSSFPSIRVFSSESILPIRWPKYWSFSFSTGPSSEYSGLISFRIDWLDLRVRESIPRQVDKKSGGSPRREGSGILKEEERTNFFSSTFLQFSSVQSLGRVRLWDPMDCSTPGLPVHHQLPEFTQTRVHWVSDTIQPSHPLSSPSPPTFNLSQHQDLFKWVSSSHQVAKVLEFQLQHQSFQWTLQDWSPLGWTGWISLQSMGLSRVFSNTTVQKHQFFSAQLSL